MFFSLTVKQGFAGTGNLANAPAVCSGSGEIAFKIAVLLYGYAVVDSRRVWAIGYDALWVVDYSE